MDHDREQAIEAICRFSKHDDEEDARLRGLLAELDSATLNAVSERLNRYPLTTPDAEVFAWLEATCRSEIGKKAGRG